MVRLNRIALCRAGLCACLLLISLLPCAWAADDNNCSSPKTLPVGTTVASVAPLGAYDSTIVPITLVGKGLGGMTLVVCPTQAGGSTVSTSMSVQNDPQHALSSTALYFLLTILPGETGTFQLYLKQGSDVYDLQKQFVVTSSDDTAYIDCGLGGKTVTKNSNVGCSYNPLSYDLTREMFGKGVADRLIVVALNVQNKNLDLEYLLQDIRLGKSGLMVGSLDKKLARRVAEKTEQFSARAISFRLVEAGATVLTGIAGVVGNEVLKDAANLVAGPVQSGFRSSIPDLSTQEISTIDDNGFSVTSTVIPKNGAISVVAFLSSQAFAPSDFKHVSGDSLIAFERSLRVQVAGIHIQQVDLSKPSLKGFVPQDPGIKAGTLSSDTPVVVQGSALNAVDSILFQFQQTSSQNVSQTFTGKLTPNGGQTSLDPSVDTIIIPKGTTLNEGGYGLSLITTDGATIQTTVKLSVSTQDQLALDGLPTSLTVGTPQQVTVTVKDGNGNVNSGFTGTVQLENSDKGADAVPPYAFTSADKGVHQFTVTFKTKSLQTLTVSSTGLKSATGSTTVN